MGEKIELDYNRFKFEIDLRKRITIIEGESATGKTLMFKAFRSEEYWKGKSSRYRTFNHNDEIENVKRIIIKETNKIIIIDNADILITEDIRDVINNDNNNNKYILIGRGLTGIRTTPNGVAEIFYNKDRNRFELKYNFNFSRG